jgi:hypothetical protein
VQISCVQVVCKKCVSLMLDHSVASRVGSSHRRPSTRHRRPSTRYRRPSTRHRRPSTHYSLSEGWRARARPAGGRILRTI